MKLERQAAEIIDHYTYYLTWLEDDQVYVGLCAEFPSLSWLEESPEAALVGIRNMVRDCIVDMQSNGEAIPEPMAVKSRGKEL